MLILSSVLNVVLLALLIYVQRRRSNLAIRLKHMGDITPADTNLPPLQSMPTPPECRMVKESFTE